MNATAKYWVVAGITLAITVLTYAAGQPTLTMATLISAGLLALGLILKDVETAPTTGS